MSDNSNTTEGLKFDSGKIDWMILFEHMKPQVEDVVKVLMHGEEKYKRDNWMHVQHSQLRYTNAMLRHILGYISGEEHDPDTGLPHLAHAICCQLFLMHGGSK